MLRRQFLPMLAAAPLAAARNRIDLSRVAVLTDEVGKTPDEAVAFAKQYGLKWVEVRGVPGGGGHYGSLPEDKLKEAVKQFHDNGLRVSFLNTPFFKITLPGTEPVLRKPETPEARATRIARHQAAFDRRKEDFTTAFRNAHILGVDKMRVFSFLRVDYPKSVEQRVVDVIGEMGEMAAKEKIKLLVENEVPCNAATSGELASLVKLLPEKTVGINWDPLNGTPHGEKPFPEGYEMLPKKRVLNVQIKGHTLLDEKQKLDWSGIFNALARDGYKGKVGLETHYFDGTLIEKSHLSMQEITRIVGGALRS